MLLVNVSLWKLYQHIQAFLFLSVTRNILYRLLDFNSALTVGVKDSL